MTAPRQVLPGTTYLVTRRCAQRQFLLAPGPVTNGTFLYLLAVAATRFDIDIHTVCVLSNHYDRTDVRSSAGQAGRLPGAEGALAGAEIAVPAGRGSVYGSNVPAHELASGVL